MRGPTWLALSFLAGSLACRPQPSAALVLDRDPADPQVEPSGLGDAPTVFVEPATRSTTREVGPELDWTKVDDRLAGLIQATGQDRSRVPYDDDHPWVGASAPMVTIVVFSDYQCPYCKKLDDTLAALQVQYGNDLRIVWRQMPLPMHAQARLAAKAALAAHAQGAFVPMHEWLFANQRNLSTETIENEAAQLGLDLVRFRADLGGDWLENRIKSDEDFAKHVHVTGTPGFFINGRKVSGAQPAETISATIDEELQLGRELVAAGSGSLEVWARILAVSDPDPAAPAPKTTTSSGPDSSKRYAVDLKGVAHRGAKKPKVEILMCGDFDCPFSAKSVATLAQLEKDNKGKLGVAYRHFPLPMHPKARAAHRAAIAAERQGQFWAMWELLYTNQQARSTAELEGFASQLGLDLDQFRKDIADPDVDAQIEADISACKALDTNATPTFFLNGRPLLGAQGIEKFQALIDEEKAGKGPPAAAKP